MSNKDRRKAWLAEMYLGSYAFSENPLRKEDEHWWHVIHSPTGRIYRLVFSPIRRKWDVFIIRPGRYPRQMVLLPHCEFLAPIIRSILSPEGLARCTADAMLAPHE